MKKNNWGSFFLLLVVCTLLIKGLFAAEPSPADSSGNDAKKTANAKQAYMGDPAMKRGFILGYDYGVKAGKEDKKNGKKESPAAHEEYKMGDKRFRSEYGSSAKFVGGYQGGFVKGYKSGYHREKVDPEAAKLSKIKEKEVSSEAKSKKTIEEKTSSGTSLKTSPPPPKPKPKVFNPSEDAL